MIRPTIDAIVLNRNLMCVTDNLIADLNRRDCFGFVGVVDAGSRDEEVSKYTVVKANSPEVKVFGLRVNRGYNLAINWWLNQSTNSQYLLLLPNDTEINCLDLELLWESLPERIKVAAIVPLSVTDPYNAILPSQGVGLGWNFNEGPIVLSREFIEFMVSCGCEVFDSKNFRSYLSFVEIALKAYANDYALVATRHISFIENESHLEKHYDLIATEESSKNAELLIAEGRAWLGRKYGIIDGMAFENLVRLSFEDFLFSNPQVKHLEIR
jgi:glycosyltransferase involved in cell wall biosynthesis